MSVEHEVAHDREALRRLFRNVIGQAAQHALGRPFLGEWPRADDREAARSWFRGDPPGLELACLWAGLPVGAVRRTIEARLRETA